MTDRWDTCWDAAPGLYVLLKESKSLESARNKVARYIEAREWTYACDVSEIEAWDYTLFKEAVRTLKNIISPKNERITGTSSLEKLWVAAVNGDADVADDFVDEFIHLFKALKLKADVYPSRLMEGIDIPNFDEFEGRKAGIMRSDYLDRMGRRMDRYLSRYKSGLDPGIIEKREGNKRRILDILNSSEDDWHDWHWQFRHIFKDDNGLNIIRQVIELDEEHESSIRLAIDNNVPFGVTPYYLHLMDKEPCDMDYAVRRQVFPPLSYVENMIAHRKDRMWAFDFMRERDTSPIDLVTRRYPRVAIVKPYESCPQICVYCQRNWEITSPLMVSAQAPMEKIEAALDWFLEHEEMMDILLTGGDPLVMSDSLIDRILSRLAQIPHLKNIRVASRMPATVPQRITEELCEILGYYQELGRRNLCLVTHFMHPYEVTPETLATTRMVKRTGVEIYNQQVFTFANSRKFETASLRIILKQIGVDPYYTFNMKGKTEIEDYAVPIARILQERKEEARLLPGIFRTDEPVFNVPGLGKDHLRAWQNHELIAITSEGRRVYSFLPWEKNIAQVLPFVYTDVSIHRYLQRLIKRGEDPEDYRSIWYYY
ncbi:MAG TPA: KamA family radical SAM protein [Methanothrix sp.]|jgi:lysine 2,3-aminomutase|uniref:KamA family radical SAM protein n=1 Tax=Methanothrix sp. TaxID=90426 RepID=UPI002C033F9A|nr:KamA family radical SAM protein [Methanothrix sp.]MDI9417361.1 KamA family radical SAM protein [Euryarchaeota archaeon]HON35186.1 KamA family radical SAM protein [Methanothrix sp.]HRU75562.1 KamA family radical SAM protein [Methanothrix sp.]